MYIFRDGGSKFRGLDNGLFCFKYHAIFNFLFRSQGTAHFPHQIMPRGSLSFALITVILCAGVQARESSFMQYAFLLKGEVCDFWGVEFVIFSSIPALFLKNKGGFCGDALEEPFLALQRAFQ